MEMSGIYRVLKQENAKEGRAKRQTHANHVRKRAPYGKWCVHLFGSSSHPQGWAHDWHHVNSSNSILPCLQQPQEEIAHLRLSIKKILMGSSWIGEIGGTHISQIPIHRHNLVVTALSLNIGNSSKTKRRRVTVCCVRSTLHHGRPKVVHSEDGNGGNSAHDAG